MGFDPTNLQIAAWNPITWDAIDLGGSEEPDFGGCELKLAPLKIASCGDIELDDIVVGLKDGAILTVTLVEVTLATVKKMMPWYTAGTQVEGIPAAGTRLYQYAKPLVFHPSHLAVATVTENFNVRKAVPLGAVQIKRNGKDTNAVAVKFRMYPDRTKLGTGLAAYFYFGAAEA